jgi:hypothetical protein
LVRLSQRRHLAPHHSLRQIQVNQPMYHKPSCNNSSRITKDKEIVERSSKSKSKETKKTSRKRLVASRIIFNS